MMRLELRWVLDLLKLDAVWILKIEILKPLAFVWKPSEQAGGR